MNSSDAGASISSRVEQACVVQMMTMRFKRRTKECEETTKRSVFEIQEPDDEDYRHPTCSESP